MERLHSCWVLEDVLILVHKGTCALAGACMQVTLGPDRQMTSRVGCHLEHRRARQVKSRVGCHLEHWRLLTGKSRVGCHLEHRRARQVSLVSGVIWNIGVY
jgi:hypothetical protein